jgi:hypothetical protein
MTAKKRQKTREKKGREVDLGEEGAKDDHENEGHEKRDGAALQLVRGRRQGDSQVGQKADERRREQEKREKEQESRQ